MQPKPARSGCGLAIGCVVVLLLLIPVVLGGGFFALRAFWTKGNQQVVQNPNPVSSTNPADPQAAENPAWNQAFQEPTVGNGGTPASEVQGDPATGPQSSTPPDDDFLVEGVEPIRPRRFDSQGPADVLQDPLSNAILDLQFTPDSRVLVAFDAAALGTLWDVKTRRGLDVSYQHLGGQADSTNKQHLAISPDGSTLAFGMWNRVTVIDLPAVKFRWRKGDISNGYPLCVSPGVNYVAVAEVDQTGILLAKVTICDVKTGNAAFTIDTGNNSVSDIPVVFSHDDKRLAIIDGLHGKIRLFSLPEGKEIGAISGVAGAHSVSFASDGSLLVPVHPDLQIWDLSNVQRPKLAYKKPYFERGYTEMLSSPDAKTLFTIPYLWDIASRSDRAKVAGDWNFGAFSSDSKRIVCWNGSEAVVADAATGKTVTVLDPGRFDEFSARNITCAALSRDGKMAALGTREGQIVLRSLSTSAPTAGSVAAAPGEAPQPTLTLEFSAPQNVKGPIEDNKYNFAWYTWLDPRGKWLVTSGHFATLWDLEAREQRMVLTLNDGKGRKINAKPTRPSLFPDSPQAFPLVHVKGWLFHDDGKTVSVAGGNGGLLHYDVAAGTHLIDGNDNGCEAIKLSPDASLAAAWVVKMDDQPQTARAATKPTLWELVILDGSTGQVRKSLGTFKPQAVRPFNYDPYWNTSFSSDGQRLATIAYEKSASRPPQIHVWDWESGQQHPLTAEAETTQRLELVDEGKTLLLVTGASGNSRSGSNPFAITTYDIELGSRGETVLLDGEHTGTITSLAFDLVQPLFVSCDEHGMALLRDRATGKPLARWQAHSAAVTAAFLSPDGQLVTAAKDGTVSLWNVADLQNGK